MDAERGQLKCTKTGKLMLTREQAARSAGWWRRSRHAHMKHYLCAWCGAHHIGNDRRPGRRKADRR